jgi:hypothetical protein
MNRMASPALGCILSMAFFWPVCAGTEERYHCDWIGIAQYKGYETKEHISYSHPPQALYILYFRLIGPPFATTRLPIRFTWDKPLASTQALNWNFDESKMPRKESWWLIFLPDAVPTKYGFETFHGAEGRIECTKKNLVDTMDGIERVHPDIHFDTAVRERLNADIDDWYHSRTTGRRTNQTVH